MISAGQISSLEIADVLREEVPGLEGRTPRGEEEAEATEGGKVEGTEGGKGETGKGGKGGNGGKGLPSEGGKGIKGLPEGGKGLPEGAFDADNGEGRRVLGVGYRSAEETFGELGRQLVGIEKGG